MKYHLRLVDQTLPGFTRELAKAAWGVADELMDRKPPVHLYRELFRETRDLFAGTLEAKRLCGKGTTCEHYMTALNPRAGRAGSKAEDELVHRFLFRGDATPQLLQRKLLAAMTRVITGEDPKQKKWKRLAPALKRQMLKVFEDRLFRAEGCGATALCGINEDLDAWDLRETENRAGRRRKTASRAKTG